MNKSLKYRVKHVSNRRFPTISKQNQEISDSERRPFPAQAYKFVSLPTS